MDYHGILVEESLKGKSFLDKLKIIGKKKGRTFNLIKISVKENKITQLISDLQKNLKGVNYYAHFYRDNELIVVFPKKIFKITPQKSSWRETIFYGKSLGIPEEQLDFIPCRIEDETY